MWMTVYKAGNLEHTAQPSGSSKGWTVSFPNAFVVLNFFQAAQLDFVSSRQLVCSESFLHSPAFIANFGRKRPIEFGQFQEFPEALLSHFPA